MGKTRNNRFKSVYTAAHNLSQLVKESANTLRENWNNFAHDEAGDAILNAYGRTEWANFLAQKAWHNTKDLRAGLALRGALGLDDISDVLRNMKGFTGLGNTPSAAAYRHVIGTGLGVGALVVPGIVQANEQEYRITTATNHLLNQIGGGSFSNVAREGWDSFKVIPTDQGARIWFYDDNSNNTMALPLDKEQYDMLMVGLQDRRPNDTVAQQRGERRSTIISTGDLSVLLGGNIISDAVQDFDYRGGVLGFRPNNAGEVIKYTLLGPSDVERIIRQELTPNNAKELWNDIVSPRLVRNTESINLMAQYIRDGKLTPQEITNLEPGIYGACITSENNRGQTTATLRLHLLRVSHTYTGGSQPQPQAGYTVQTEGRDNILAGPLAAYGPNGGVGGLNIRFNIAGPVGLELSALYFLPTESSQNLDDILRITGGPQGTRAYSLLSDQTSTEKTQGYGGLLGLNIGPITFHGGAAYFPVTETHQGNSETGFQNDAGQQYNVTQLPLSTETMHNVIAPVGALTLDLGTPNVSVGAIVHPTVGSSVDYKKLDYKGALIIKF